MWMYKDGAARYILPPARRKRQILRRDGNSTIAKNPRKADFDPAPTNTQAPFRYGQKIKSMEQKKDDSE